ncbi:MAG TPA: hypothetical protein VNN77_11345 [candidate division Zixibacteria bacterium]|nr:hypothetical protein [candidate division Zixibacteria bacterium]
MDRVRERILELADIIGAHEGPSSKVVEDAKEEFKRYVHKLDGDTQKEVMERIRGFAGA